LIGLGNNKKKERVGTKTEIKKEGELKQRKQVEMERDE
jgi:hypothetical protein